MAEAQRQLLSIVIVSYNVRELLEACLRSLPMGGVEEPEVWVVDNASTDGSVEMVRHLFPTVNLNRNSIGQVNGQFDLTGKGDSVGSLLASSNGKLGLVVAGGEVSKLMMEKIGLHLWEILSLNLTGDRLVKLRCAVADLQGRKLYAIAGTGDPHRFFRQLQALGLEFAAHPFPDHHRYQAGDLAFARDGVLLMTEKDAVKCAAIASGEAWVLPVEAVIGTPPGHAGLFETILEKLHGRTPA